MFQVSCASPDFSLMLTFLFSLVQLPSRELASGIFCSTWPALAHVLGHWNAFSFGHGEMEVGLFNLYL